MNAEEIEDSLRKTGYPTDAKGLSKLIHRFVAAEVARLEELVRDLENELQRGCEHLRD